jgi:hypothetical protein
MRETLLDDFLAELVPSSACGSTAGRVRSPPAVVESKACCMVASDVFDLVAGVRLGCALWIAGVPISRR